MKNLIPFLIFLLSPVLFFAQSKKEVKKNRIKASVVTSTENGKTVNDSKTVFDINTGETIEKTEYEKDGKVKVTHKYKYDKDGDQIEEEEYDANGKLSEKKVTKYNSLKEKTEEQFFDGAGKLTKKHVYSYDGKGLRIEKKEFDSAGKTVSVKKYTYELK